MQNNLLTISIILLVSIFIANILILIYMFKQARIKNNHNSDLNANYLDLNFKFQLVITTLWVVGVAITTLGWNVKTQIVGELKSEILSDVKDDLGNLKGQAELLNLSYKESSNAINNIQNNLYNLENSTMQLIGKYDKLDNLLSERMMNIETILKIYIVPDIKLVNEDSTSHYDYKNLKPINSSNLPKFKKPPIVMIQTTAGALTFDIEKNTEEYIEIRPNMIHGEELYLTFWIVERE